jgi:integrase/recombinase XerD
MSAITLGTAMLLSDAVRQYLNALLAGGRSAYTVRGAKSALKTLMAFLSSAGVENIEHLTHDVLLRYREALSWHVTGKGTPLTARSQSELLGHLRAFCRWMVAQDWLVSDPSKRIPNPRKPQQLPKAILDEEEVERILAQPDMQTARGYRDRAILEVLYSSGIRREEAANLRLEDVDTEHGFLIVREGKNRKDRAVPIGASVCTLLQSYIVGVRKDWLGAGRDRHLFLNRFGQGMGPNAVWHVVHKYARAANIDRSVSTHTFRHSCATHMLRAGAPIRHLQEMLGHASIETTQVYTRVTITDLKAAHRRFHPRERHIDGDAGTTDGQSGPSCTEDPLPGAEPGSRRRA